MLEPNDLADAIEAFPEVLRALLAHVEDDALTAIPAPGEWCVLEVIGHLIDCEHKAFLDRITGLASGAEEVAGFDPRPGMAARAYADESLDALLAELELLRRDSAATIRSLSAEDLTREGRVASFGDYTAGDFAHEWPYHDQAHLIQIIEALKPSYLGAMTPTMRKALAELGL